MQAHSPDIAAKIAAYEAELDQIHDGWRLQRRFDDQPYDLKARIKWLLKRLALLSIGNDWDVMIVRDSRNATQCYAHPVLPATRAFQEVTLEPPSPLGALPSTVADLETPCAGGEPALAANTDRDQLRQLTRGKRKPAAAVAGGAA